MQLAVLKTTCAGCGARLTWHERVSGGWCSDWQCRHRRIEAGLRQRLAESIDRARAAAAADDAEAAAAPPVTVRWFAEPLEAVPQPLIDKLRAHLMALEPEVDALAAQAGPAPPAQRCTPSSADDPVDGLLAAICARCTGYCCRYGLGRHAFLDAEALLRARRLHPQADHAGLVGAYLAHAPVEHHHASCIFHGARGCTLPRQMRSAICNDYQCSGLEQAQEMARARGVRRVFVVRHEPGREPVGTFVPALVSDAAKPACA